MKSELDRCQVVELNFIKQVVIIKFHPDTVYYFMSMFLKNLYNSCANSWYHYTPLLCQPRIKNTNIQEHTQILYHQ